MTHIQTSHHAYRHCEEAMPTKQSISCISRHHRLPRIFFKNTRNDFWLYSFVNETTGGMFAFIGISIATIIVSMGVSIDMARGYMVKTQLSAALDAAGLAGGAVINSPDMQADITRYFNANFDASMFDATLDGPHVTTDQFNSILNIAATATIKTRFMGVAGIDTMDVSASAEITRETRGMEVMLVMDNTGSMYGSKMTTMKEAATDLVNILYAGEETAEDLWIGLVPYAATVNIGSQHADWLDAAAYAALDYTPTTWKGCVEARLPTPDDITDDLPETAGGWTPYFWASSSDNTWPPIDERVEARNDGTGPNLGCGPAITPLTDNKQLVLDSIDEMEAWHRGGTLSNLGMAWGWRAISPKWRGRWGAPSSANLPLDYNEPLMDKVVIILTDGVNQFYDHQGGGPQGSDYTAYGRVGEGRTGHTSNNTATPEINDRMVAVCNAMKAEGIIVYSITFRLNDSDTRAVFRNCATDPAFYYNSPSNADLRAAFRAIGDSLANLRISK